MWVRRCDVSLKLGFFAQILQCSGTLLGSMLEFSAKCAIGKFDAMSGYSVTEEQVRGVDMPQRRGNGAAVSPVTAADERTSEKEDGAPELEI